MTTSTRVRTTVKLVVAAGVAALAAACSSGPSPAPAAEQAAGSYAFWPPAPDEPRVQFVKTFQSMQDVSQKEASGLEKVVFGKEVENAGTVNKPYGVAVHDGKIYVCDIRNRSLTVMDLKKKQTRLVGVTGQNQLRHPVAVAVGDDGVIYVADNERSAVLVFDAQERFAMAIGHEKFKPAGVAVHGTRLYAASTSSQVVEVFDTQSGKPVGTIGSLGDDDGQFRLPVGVATDAKGDVYVSDMMRCRVQKFTPEGKFLMGFGTQGDFAGAFVRPKHLAVDAEGIIYVVDAGFQNVQMFNPEGKLLMFFGSSGEHPGAMDLPVGVGVCEGGGELVEGLVHPGFKAKRLVVVTNQMGASKVSLYAMGGVKEGHTVAELTRGSLKVAPGTATPTADELKFANPGTVDPGAEPGAAPGAAKPVAPASPVAPR